jgi:hypothetical protein
VKLETEPAPPQSTAIVLLDPTGRLILALSAVPVWGAPGLPSVVAVRVYVEPVGHVPGVHEILYGTVGLAPVLMTDRRMKCACTGPGFALVPWPEMTEEI